MTKTLEIVEGDVDDYVACDACGTARAYYQDKLWEVAVTVVDMSHLPKK